MYVLRSSFVGQFACLQTGLAHVCSNGSVEMLQVICRLPVNVNVVDNEGNSPLIFAAQAGTLDT